MLEQRHDSKQLGTAETRRMNPEMRTGKDSLQYFLTVIMKIRKYSRFLCANSDVFLLDGIY
jgi:hypothetical protein